MPTEVDLTLTVEENGTPRPLDVQDLGDQVDDLSDGRKVVTTPGTAVAIATSTPCKWVLVTALKTNTAQVNVGGSGVLAEAGSETGQPLAAGDGVTFPVSDVAFVYVDARVEGEGVTFTSGI